MATVMKGSVGVILSSSPHHFLVSCNLHYGYLCNLHLKHSKKTFVIKSVQADVNWVPWKPGTPLSYLRGAFAVDAKRGRIGLQTYEKLCVVAAVAVEDLDKQHPKTFAAKLSFSHMVQMNFQP